MTTPAPKLSRFPGFSLIWVVPVVALAVALWMLAREWSNHGTEITIELADASGLEPGQTALDYKGVAIGQVKKVGLAEDLGGVVVHVQLTRKAAAIAREGSQFWVVQPEIGFAGVSGLETLLTGAHLEVRPGTGAPASRFRGLDAPPAPPLAPVAPAPPLPLIWLTVASILPVPVVVALAVDRLATPPAPADWPAPEPVPPLPPRAVTDAPIVSVLAIVEPATAVPFAVPPAAPLAVVVPDPPLPPVASVTALTVCAPVDVLEATAAPPALAVPVWVLPPLPPAANDWSLT